MSNQSDRTCTQSGSISANLKRSSTTANHPTHQTKVSINNKRAVSGTPQTSTTMSTEVTEAPMDEQPPNTAPNIYNCQTTNRFAILQIPTPAPTTLRAPKVEKPPPIIVYQPASKLKPHLPSNQHFVIANLRVGTKLLCNTIEQHRQFITLLDNKKVPYHTYPYENDRCKRFVLYGLNTHPIDDIMKELENYNLAYECQKPSIRRPRHILGILQAGFTHQSEYT